MNDKSLPQKESDNEQKLKKAEIIELEQELLSVNPRIFDGIKNEPYDTHYRATYIKPTNYYANSKFADYCNKKI